MSLFVRVCLVFTCVMSVWAEEPLDTLITLDEQQDAPVAKSSEEVVDAWRQKRLGMFIHWGPISQLSDELSWSRKPRKIRGTDKMIGGGGKIPVAEYDALGATFNPINFDAADMVALAKKAGCGYMVFTAKHHAGYAMFHTDYSDHCLRESPYEKDIVAEFAEACAASDVGLGIYYSPIDWYSPDFGTDNHEAYIQQYLGQVEELVSKYGPLTTFWFDGYGGSYWPDQKRMRVVAEQVVHTIRKHQPRVMLNDRGVVGSDFYTPEVLSGVFNRDRAWETCYQAGLGWGHIGLDRYNLQHDAFVSKRLRDCFEHLAYVVGRDGNYLLNIGPMADGTVSAHEREILEKIGGWVQKNPGAVVGTRGGPWLPSGWGAATCAENTIYLHVLRWPKSGSLELTALPNVQVKSARVLAGGDATVEVKDDCWGITVLESDRAPAPYPTVVALELDQRAFDITPQRSRPSLLERPTTTVRVEGASKVEHLEAAWDGSLENQATIQIPAWEDESPVVMTIDFGEQMILEHFMAEWSHSIGNEAYFFELRQPDGSYKAPDSAARQRHWQGGYHIRYGLPTFQFDDEVTDQLRIRIQPGKNGATLHYPEIVIEGRPVVGSEKTLD